MSSRVNILLLLAFALANFSAWAQSPYFVIHSLEKGQKNARVELVFESDGGFFWFGSREGLFQYDGLVFTRFPAPDSITNNQVSAIFENHNHQLWVGYRDGAIFYLDHKNQLVLWEPEEGLPQAPITGFAEDSSGALWFSTYGEGLYYMLNGRMNNMNSDDGLLGDDIYTLVGDGHDNFWLGTDRGISICSIKEGKKNIRNLRKQDGLPDEIVRSILPDEKGNFWIGTYDKGVCYFNTKTWEFEHIFPEWSKGVVNALELFEGRELWIGTERNGLLRYEFATRGLNPINSLSGLPGAKVYDLHKDVEGNIWVITNTHGICSANRQFELIGQHLDNIQAVLVDRRNTLWVGTQEGLFTFSKTLKIKSIFNRN